MATAATPATAGSIHVAPTGSTLPTSASSTLDSAFKDLGYVSDAGVIRTLSLDSETVKEWGGSVVLALGTGKTEEFKFTLLDVTEEEVMKLVYSTVTSATSAISATQGADNRAPNAFVIDMVLADSKIQRIVVPKGLVTSVGDIQYVMNAAVGFELTITAMADDSGNTSYDYIA